MFLVSTRGARTVVVIAAALGLGLSGYPALALGADDGEDRQADSDSPPTPRAVASPSPPQAALDAASNERPTDEGAQRPPPKVQHFNSGKILPTTLPFSEAVQVDNTLYLSGQIGVQPGTMALVPGGMQAEARRTLENIEITLNTYGYAREHVVKCLVMLADIGEWGDFNAVYQTFFSPPYPARSALGANGLALGARVEVECMAVR